MKKILLCLLFLGGCQGDNLVDDQGYYDDIAKLDEYVFEQACLHMNCEVSVYDEYGIYEVIIESAEVLDDFRAIAVLYEDEEQSLKTFPQVGYFDQEFSLGLDSKGVILQGEFAKSTTLKIILHVNYKSEGKEYRYNVVLEKVCDECP